MSWQIWCIFLLVWLTYLIAPFESTLKIGLERETVLDPRTIPNLLLSCYYPGSGASDGPAADWDVSGPPETDHLRELHRSFVHTRAPPGEGLHLEDGGLQPPHPVSTPRCVCLFVDGDTATNLNAKLGANRRHLQGYWQDETAPTRRHCPPPRGDEAWCIIIHII